MASEGYQHLPGAAASSTVKTGRSKDVRLAQDPADTRVLVTGASGFVGSHVTKQLLEAGYTVRGTVRDPSNAAKTAFLTDMAADLPGTLELVRANLNDPASFPPVVEGCDCIMHIASPYTLTVEDPQRDLLDPAVEGTMAVLQAAHGATHPVRRIVLTSSMAAITDQPVNGHVYTDVDWNERSTLTRNPYYLSKMLAERTAWSFIEGHSPTFDLVTINPFGIWGPSLGPSMNTTNGIVKMLATGGAPIILSLTQNFTDVRDVAAAHVAAMAQPHASGRYPMAMQGPTPLPDLVQGLRALGLQGEGYALPTMRFDGACGICCTINCLSYAESGGTRDYLQTNTGRVLVVDNARATTELGIVPIPFHQSLKDIVADMIAQGHLPPCPAADLAGALPPTALSSDARPAQGVPVAMTVEELSAYRGRGAASVPIPPVGSEGCCDSCCCCVSGVAKGGSDRSAQERKEQ